MPYVDPNTIHNPATGTVAPATWGDTVRDDLEFLVDSPAVSVFHSTTQSITSSTQTVLNADSENFDNDAMHSTVTNNSRITAQTAGRYLFSGTVLFNADATGARSVAFYVNATTAYIATSAPSIGGSLDMGLSGARMIVLAAGDYVQCRAFQNTGGSLSVTLLEFAATFLTR